MDTLKEEKPGPLYEYTATVWVSRTYKVVAESDDLLEEAVQQALEEDGLDPDEFPLVRLQSTRTPIQWQ
jgi:hypothetical protein